MHQLNASEPQSFDLRQMASALPTSSEQPTFENRPPSGHYNAATMMGPASFQYPQMAQYGQQRQDPNYSRIQQQQQHYAQQQMVPQAPPYQYVNRPHPPQMQPQANFHRMEPYPYGASPSNYSPVDMRFPQQAFPMGYGPSGSYSDMSMSTLCYAHVNTTNIIIPDQFARRTSETPPAAIPSLPRGPPRKPKQSGHALWVGNLPPAATVTDLKDHFSRDATTDIQSLFLISKSNCAFVNYKSEAACVAAMNRFHDSRFHGIRLVCRLRRGSTSSTSAPTTIEPAKAATDQDIAPKTASDSIPNNGSSDPIIVGGAPTAQAAADNPVVPTTAPTTKVPEKFFIVKSLTLQDLEASVRNGIWATQSHNESTLNEAFNAAENVYLIFSANKSGEYFGYARMCSEIAGEAVSTTSTPSPQPTASNDGPKSIPTPATETAPRGRIIDDSARGTIFWEAELNEEEERGSPDKGSEEGADGQDLGRPFKIEWISTARLPFYRTRGLRNPWNANREVKIARDGTELEPSIGKRLVQMFHRPAHAAPPHPMQAGGMPYQMV
jgi:RNA recognition motif-containing protein